MKTKLILFAIILFAAFFRFYNLNWDQGHHLHPDERAIILTVVKLSPPNNFQEFLSITSPWNPHFFAYGSFPFYLLYFVGLAASSINPLLATYDYVNILGRGVSAFSDLLTIIILFKLGRKLFSEKIGLISAFFYALSALPIQLSHFYAVDTLLTLFILATLYQLILFYEKPTGKRAVLIGTFFGLALATKVSALILITSIGVSLIADFLLLFLKQPHKPKHYLPHLPAFIKHLASYAFIIALTTGAVFAFFEPYALIDFKNFWLQTIQQSAMTRDAFTFPYTLQYVGKIPYFYELKNIFFFGLGPVLATVAFCGFFYFSVSALRKEKKNKWAGEIILLAFIFAYFVTVGKFAVGFMRYMLPLYPFLCLFAAVFVFNFFTILKQTFTNKLLLMSCFLLFSLELIIWPASFIHIYKQDNTRVAATNWILQNIPAGKTLAVEHWDDQLPLIDAQKYLTETLALYEPDTEQKWQIIKSQLGKTDYLIIASNRLYTPLQKLTSCSQLPIGRCYTQTAEYYQKLFTDELGFRKVAEFSSYPTIPLVNISINDEKADESFTVYDHPKVMIFKKK